MNFLQSLLSLFGLIPRTEVKRDRSIPLDLDPNTVENLFEITGRKEVPKVDKNKADISPPPPLKPEDMVRSPDKRIYKPSPNLVDFVKNYEQFRPEAYQDAAGVWTVGYGTTKGVDMYSKISEEKARKRLQKDLEKAAEEVNAMVKVPLTQSEFDALVSLVYNVGATNFRKSKALKALNKGDMSTFLEEAFDPVKGFVRSSGKINKGLQRRRQDERSMFEKQAYNRTYRNFDET